jgi:hypothetical protein
MPAKTKSQRLADLKEKFGVLVKKYPQYSKPEIESYNHQLHRTTASHDKLTADQKIMNELERKIRKLEGHSAGTRRRRHRTRRH